MIQKYLQSVRTYFVSTFSISLHYDIDDFVSTDQDFFSLIQVWINGYLQSKNSMGISMNCNRILFWRNEKSRTLSLLIFWASSFTVSRLSYNGKLYLLQNIAVCRFGPYLGRHIVYKYNLYYIDSVFINISRVLGFNIKNFNIPILQSNS